MQKLIAFLCLMVAAHGISAQCTYAQALNFDPAAVLDNGKCTFNISSVGCLGYDFNADGVIGAPPDILAVLGAYGTVCE